MILLEGLRSTPAIHLVRLYGVLRSCNQASRMLPCSRGGVPILGALIIGKLVQIQSRYLKYMVMASP